MDRKIFLYKKKALDDVAPLKARFLCYTILPKIKWGGGYFNGQGISHVGCTTRGVAVLHCCRQTELFAVLDVLMKRIS